MHSKRHRNLREFEMKKRPIGLFILIGFVILGLGLFFSYRAIKSLLVLERVIIKGNKVISEEELKRIAGLRNSGKRSLIDISSSEVYHRLIGSPWIKEAVVKKGIPDRLIIWVEEARPEAVIKREGRLYLIDDTGVILEELRQDSPVMLPVLEIDYENRELLLEALLLLKEMRTLNITPGEGNITLTGSKKEDLTILLRSGGSGADNRINQVSIRVGYGRYNEKLKRLIDFAPSIRQRAISPSIIDLRFNDRVIVKGNEGAPNAGQKNH
ncbi:MAG: cell division protein FtsQ/DivIB [Thermodesulfovibrionales bacterium]